MATPIRIKRSAVSGKRPTLEQLGKGELAINLYDGHLFAERDTEGVGIGTTISLLTPWQEEFGGGEIKYTGVVSATTYHGDQIIGTPTGGFKSGAFTIGSDDKTKDSINELNNILGKLVPSAPDTINGVSLSLSGLGQGRLCTGFSPTNNTGGDLTPSAGTQYSRNTDSTVTTSYLTEYGPGDSGTVTGYINAVGVGTTTLSTGSNNGTYGALQIANDEDASNSTRNTGIASGFYEIYDVRLINATSPDGFNKAYIEQGSSTTQKSYWYEDPSTVGAPVISFPNPIVPPNPATDVTAFSSGVPHFTESTNNNFTYQMTVTNASGDMYSSSTLVTSDGQTDGFQNPGNKSYTDFGGTNPPARNFGVETGVTYTIVNTPRNVHDTITTNHFSRYDCSTPYGSHNNQRISYSTNINIMGTSATTSKIDEDNILVSSLGTGSGNATRVNAGSGSGDNPSPVYTSWSASGTAATYEAIVRGGVLRHDQTDYSSGYWPVGPDYSSSRSGAQYFQMEFIRSNVSEFNITVTGTYGGCWVCMPDNSTWTTALSGPNGWANMFVAYRGAGTPISTEPGCASGGNMDGTSGTFTCTFGTESSSNDSNNRILIRWRLDSGDSITAMSFSAT